MGWVAIRASDLKGEKGFRHLGIKHATRVVPDEAERLLLDPTAPVRPLADQGIVDIGQGEYARAQADGLTSQTFGIALTVEAFMVLFDDLLRRFGNGDEAADPARAEGRSGGG